MVKDMLRALAPEKLVLVVVLKEDSCVFDRSKFATRLGNKASRFPGESPRKAGARLLKAVTRTRNPPIFTVVRSPAIGETVHFVFWFPRPGEFQLSNWLGKVAMVSDDTLVSERKRRVIETALARAQVQLGALQVA